MVLGIGAVISRQFDKGIERLNKVVAFDPQNLEAVSWLADAYAGYGDRRMLQNGMSKVNTWSITLHLVKKWMKELKH